MVVPITLFQSHKTTSELENLFGKKVREIHRRMNNGTATGASFLGWRNLPKEISANDLGQVIKVANKLRDSAELVVIIGIGGSYLGAKAVQEALSPYFEGDVKDPEVLYAGQNLSGTYMKQLLNYMDGKEVAVIVISKSGTTTEPAIALRIILNYMENRYESSVSERIVAITDKSEGALREIAICKGFTTFVIPDDVGGRYSVLTPVGLLPLAVAGIDIEGLLAGAKDAVSEYSTPDIDSNHAYQYATLRNHLLTEGYHIEILASFSPRFATFHEWWKQLFGESEGKDGKGIFPVSVAYPTDLHSLGQYIQEGQCVLFETFVQFEKPIDDCAIPVSIDNLDGLNYLSDKTMNDISEVTMLATMQAHDEGGVPLIHLAVAKQDAYHIGYLIYFFEISCAMSAYLLGVNPFDQPGVEAYKKNLFRLLDKPELVEQS